MLRRFPGYLAIVLLAIVESGCAGGSKVLPSAVKTEGAQAAIVQVAIRIAVPNKTQAVRRGEFISPSTQSMSISVDAGPATNVNLTPASPNCLPGPPVSCTATIASTVGLHSFLVKLYDAIGGAGGTGSVIATNSVSYTVVAGTNTLPLVLNGVVSAVSLSLASPSLAAGAAALTSLTVNATDTDGNIIVSPGSFSDAAGHALTINLATTQSQPAVVSPYTAGTAVLGSSSIASPGAAISVSYDGKALLSTLITATVTGGAAVAPATTTLTLTPTVYEYSLPAGSGPGSLIVGPDKLIWLAVNSGGVPSIGHFVPIGPGGSLALTNVPTPLTDSGYSPLFLAAGSDGNIWYTDWNQAIFRAPVTATLTTDSVQFSVVDNKPAGIVDGGDGNMYMTYSYFYGPAYFPVASTPGPITPTDFGIGGANGGMIVGPDQRVWTTAGQGGCCYAPLLYAIATGVSSVHTNSSFSFGQDMSGVAAGSDGNIWYTEHTAQQIGRIPPNAAMASQRTDLYLGGSSQPTWIVGGPDGAIYFIDAGTTSVGRVPITATSGNLGLVEYSVPSSPTGFNSILAGPDGNLWFGETGSSPKVGKLAI